MAIVPRSFEPVDDVGALARQRAKSLYPRRIADAQNYLYGRRGRLIAHRTFENGLPTNPLPNTEVGRHTVHRTETDRLIVIAATLSGGPAVFYADVYLSIDVDVAPDDGSHGTPTSTVAAVRAVGPSRDWFGKDPSAMRELLRGRAPVRQVMTWELDPGVADDEIEIVLRLGGESTLHSYTIYEAPFEVVSP